MPNCGKVFVFALCFPFAAHALAQGPTILNYQGRVSVAGKPFSGKGHFSFVILDGAGEVLWSSGPFPLSQTTNLPPGATTLAVSNGLYAVRLGDPTAGMPPLDAPTLATAFAPKLRIWFNDGTHAWQQAGDDVPLASVVGSGDKTHGAPLAGASADIILRELKQVRMMLERQRVGLPTGQQPGPRLAEPLLATVPIGDGPSLGRPDAPLVLVEFTDYECSFCRRFHETVMPELIKTYVDTGKLRIVSRNLPLAFHTNAEPAALAALCAHDQQKFWAMREKLFTNNNALSVSNAINAAKALALNVTAFRACMDQQTFAAQLKKDATDARAAGITGTPSFVLGKPADGRVTGVLVVGARPFATFDAEVRKLLGASK